MSEVISLNQEWHIGDQLGKGGFGRVFSAQSVSGEAAVVKLVPKAPGAAREILFEDLAGVPHVVPIIDSGEWGDFWVLVMPKADKSLRQYLSENIDHLSLDDTVRVISDVTQALEAIEGRVVHRDIKPDNILLLDGQWCLADFGISRYAETTTDPDTRKFSMTPHYAAPEQWRWERASSATDVYSLGVVAYELIAGQLPFVGPAVDDYRRQHLEDTPKSISGVPLKLQSLIDDCLNKRPEARPLPQNLLARLKEGIWPTSGAASSLQQANAIATHQRAETARQESVARSEAERRSDLCEDAKRALERVVRLLNDQIVSNAPASQQSGPTPQRLWLLNEANLSVTPSRMAEQLLDTDTYRRLFEVVAYSSITLQIKPDPYGFRGRSHSLWYCDAQEAGVFRWYETAFMVMPLMRRRSNIDPFALAPSQEAFAALSPVMGQYQVAWPFAPIDQGDESEFIERWLGWFGEAAQGLLRHPNSMPERDPQGTWRRAR